MSHNPDEGFHWLEIEPSDVVFVLRRHLWLLLGAPAVGFALALLVSFLMRPQFTTEALIYLRPNFDKDMQVERGFSKLEDDDSLRSMERSMISDTVILKMVDHLGLRDDEDFLGRGALNKGPLSDAKLLKLIRKRYKTELVPTTRLVEFKVDDYSAQRAVEVADALIDQFLKHLGSDRAAKEADLRIALTAQAEKSLAATLELEGKLEEFRSQHPDQFVEQDSEIFHERLLQQGEALNDANSEMALLAGSVEALRSIDPGEDPYLVFQVLSNRNSDYLSELLTMLAAAKTDLAGVKRRATERDPDYRAAVSRLEQVEETMREYALEMKNGVESEYRASVEKVAKLGETLIGLQGDFVDFKSTSAEFRGVKGEIDRNWSTFSQLQQSIMDLDLEPETTPTFVTVVSEPVVPYKMSKPIRLLWVLAGTLLGGMVAGGLIFLRHSRGLPFTSPEQAAQRFDAAAVATLRFPDDGSSADTVAEFEQSKELLNVLISLRDSRLVHITAAGLDSAPLNVPEVLGRLCGRHGMKTLWIELGYGFESSLQSQPTDSTGLSKIRLSACELLDAQEFRSSVEVMEEKFDKILVDTTGLDESEARLAVAQMVSHTLLLVDGGRVPRSAYEPLVNRARSAENCQVTLLYISPYGGGTPGERSSAEYHHVGARPYGSEDLQERVAAV